MVKAVRSKRKLSLPLVRTVLGLLGLIVGALSLGFVLGLARPRNNGLQRPPEDDAVAHVTR